MHARLLAASSLSMSAAAGFSAGLFAAPIGVPAAIACGLGALVLTLFRDTEVAERVLASHRRAELAWDAPAQPELTVESYRPTRSVEVRTLKRVSLVTDFEAAEPTAHVFAEGDAVSFVLNNWDCGAIAFKGTIMFVYPGELGAQVDVGEAEPMLVPHYALRFEGDR